MKKYQILLAAACIGFLPKPAQAVEGTVFYACTRNASKGVTQTYIAPIKNGVPVCNNKKHFGPFPLLDTSLLGSAGVPGPQGAKGPQGAQGADGKDGSAGPAGEQGPVGDKGPDGTDGATVNGTLFVCGSGISWFPRQSFCTLEGTSFLFRTLNYSSPEGGDPFSFHHVPDGDYTLKCDTESFCPSIRYYTSSASVTVTNGATVNVETQFLCEECLVIEQPSE